MITVDVHTHTRHSHAHDSTRDMAAAAAAKGLETFGFSEHSLRPEGYAYQDDYQERLAAGFPAYVREVREEQARYAGRMTVLLGLELDYIPGQEEFARKACAAYPFDYIIGGLHFQGSWGFDGNREDWAELSPASCYEHFARYYSDLARMAACGLFQIAAHPDLMKIFRVESFRHWLELPEAVNAVTEALLAVRDNGLSMELSSAGLRKNLGEPYPGPVIMGIAARLGVPITFGSDAHSCADVAWGFDQLAAYATEFGYTSSVWFEKKTMKTQSFS